ncbi:MAG: hypothetical protein Pg6C_01720 [Treponemataceae bacterium]|nr:MAG: hypothetical protein Pg6C_01720 [Treponemataceae bacterium]
MPMMTEAEAAALDEELTRTTPAVNPNVRGVTAHKGFKTVTIDDFSADYITARALATRQTPEEVISEMVREKIAVLA